MNSQRDQRRTPVEKNAIYDEVHAQLIAMLQDERDFLANAANCVAVLFHSLPEINWAGFYFLKGTDLVLGPFQGQPACVRIGHGRGVCGAAALRKQTLTVADVHQFPGHIACDSSSNSEIVVPLLQADRLIGVLDLDSPVLNRFDDVDAAALQSIVATLLDASDVELAQSVN